MSARSRYSSSSSYGGYGYDQLVAGERIGPPLAGAAGKALLRGLFLLLVAGGVSWLMLSDRQTWPAWLSNDVKAVARWIERSSLELRAQTASPPRPVRLEAANKPVAIEAPITSAPMAASRAEPPSELPARPEPAPITTAALPYPTTAAPAAAAEPFTPPRVDPSDPYQARAAAAGLHPELSRVLLARLSETDYRNARTAVETAVAETPDNAVFVWPRQRKPDLALFRVRFVAGAAPGCRRYVVTVVKDGWLTTALPMEKCKAETVTARRR
jgi:hypothetical protein